MKPMVNVLNDAIWAVNGSSLGKYSLSMTRAVAVPYRKKSYHSMVVPMVLATTASIRDRRGPASGSAVVIGAFLMRLAAIRRTATIPLPAQEEANHAR